MAILGPAPGAAGAIKGLQIDPVSKKYGVPREILWGVYGLETGFGHNISTSSAGARGAFQFIESTAREYRYPYLNSNNPQVVQEQLDAAAHYLSDLKKRTGSWDAALHAYSGGAYGLANVKSEWEANPPPKPYSPSVGEVLNPLDPGTIGTNLGEIKEKTLGGLTGIWKKGAELTVSGLLLAAGLVLVIYGIMVAVRPRESAFSIPMRAAL